MSYLVPSLFYIFFLSCSSLYIKKLIKVNSYLALTSAFSFISLLAYFFSKTIYLQFNYLFIPFLIFSLFICYKYKYFILDQNIKRFFIYSSILLFFCYNKYFLDEDELTFWGINSKYFFYIPLYADTYIEEKLFNIQYHSLLLPSFKSILSIFFSLREDFLIFCNNLIILILFFSLFRSKKNNFYTQLMYFILFYIIINLFSFGLHSVYADIIVVALSALIYKELIFNKLRFHYNLKSLNILILMIVLPLIHRIGYLFLFVILINYILINIKYYRVYKLDSFLLSLTLALIIIVITVYPHPQLFYITQLKSLDLENKKILIEFFFYLKNLFLFNTPYIKVFSFQNDLMEFFNVDIEIPIISIKVYHVFILYFLTNLFFFKNSKHNYLNLLIFVIFISTIFFTKMILENNLHPSATIRYLMLFFLFDLILKLSIKFDSFKKRNNLKLVFILLLFCIPSKSFGFLLPTDIYIQDKKNKDYYLFINKLKKIRETHKFPSEKTKFYLIDDTLTSLEISRVLYEFYPHIHKPIAVQDKNTGLFYNIISIFSKDEFNQIELDNEYIHVVLTKNNLIETRDNVIIEKL